jgi:uncharacterized membrane-anchored protein YhcB (DUF1043 family)
MANEWFCKIADTEIGPLSPQQLKAMAVKGRLTPEDEVRRGTNGAWNPAGAVVGLFPKSDSSAAWADTAEIPVAGAKKLPPAKPAVKPKSAAPARPIPAPKSTATAQSASPLDTITADFSSVVKHSTRRSEDGAAAKRQQDKTLWTVCGIGFVVLVIVGVIALVVMTNRAKDKTATDDAKSESKTAKSEAKTAAKSESKPDSKTDTTNTEAKPAEKTVAKTPKKEEPKPETPTENETWVDASSDSITRGDMKIKVVSATVGKPRVVTPEGRSAVYPGEALLMVTVELQNTGKKKIEYAGWGTTSATNKVIELVDNRKRPCARSVFRSYRPELQLTKVTVGPDDTIEDLLVFQPPPRDDRTEFLRLTLPAAAFGEKGTLNFKIPADMIKTEKAPAKGKTGDSDAKPPLILDDGSGEGIGIPPKKPVELDPDKQLELDRRAHEKAMEESAPPEAF